MMVSGGTMTGCQKPKFSVENQEDGFKIFFRRTRVSSIWVLYLWYKFQLDRPCRFRVLENVEKEGGGTLNSIIIFRWGVVSEKRRCCRLTTLKICIFSLFFFRNLLTLLFV